MKLKFHRYDQPHSFRSPSDFARYADDQRAKFEELKQEAPKDFEWWGSAVSSNWAQAASAARSPDADQQSIQRSLTDRPVFPFSSRLVPVLRRITGLGQTKAAQSVLPFLKGDLDGNAGNHIHVMTIDAHAQFLIAIEMERSNGVGGKNTAIDQVVADHEDRLDSLLESDRMEIEAQRAAFAKVLDAAEKRHSLLTQKAKDAISSGKEQWAATLAEFIEQLATDTAVKLWSDRSSAHEDRYKSFRAWTIGYGLVGLAITIVWIFGGFAFARSVFPNDKTAQLASYAAGSVALFTLFVWGLRVLIRSMMSENHLATDASARSALAHTYLALTKEQAATPEDRAIILATLFAPVSDGLVKDDGMPAFSPTAFAAQVLTNPGR